MLFLNILGTILKIIGLLLLGILLLLVFILLVFLLVPLRYRARLERSGKELSVQAQVSYLFHLVRLPVSFREGKLQIKLYVFGIQLFSNEGGGRARRRKAKKAVPQEQGETEKAGECAEKSVPGGDGENAPEPEDQRAGTLQAQQNQDAGQTSADAASEISGEKAVEFEAEADTAPPQQQSRDAQTTQDIPGGLLKPIWCVAESVKKLLNRIRAIFEKIASAVQNMKKKILAVITKISDIKGMAGLVLEFLRDEENKNGIKYAWKSILRLLKHVFPYKIEGELVFATGNPYSMGRALSVLGMLYPLYAKKLSLTADFKADSFRLDGCVQLKGRVRFGTVLWIAWKLWSKGKLKRLLSQAKKLKNKLTTSAL